MPLFKRAKGGLTSNQIILSDIKSDIIDTDLSAVSSADDTLPSAKAVKTYVDAEIAKENELSEMNDVTITSVQDNNHVQYDGTASRWINNAFIDFSKISAPDAPSDEEGRLYVKEIDSNNNALAIKIQKAGTVVEVELTSPGCVCECGSTDGAKDPTYDFERSMMLLELYCGHSYEVPMSNWTRVA